MIEVHGVSLGFGRAGGVAVDPQDLASGGDRVVVILEVAPSVDEVHRYAADPRVQGLVTPLVSSYSHATAAIWSAGVPALALARPRDVRLGSTIVLDLDAGTLSAGFVPGEKSVPTYEGAVRLPLPHLLAEVENRSELRVAQEAGCRGVGVVRSAAVFDPRTLALRDRDLLLAIVSSFPDEPLFVRFFDTEVGGADRGSGALGARGIRAVAQQPEILTGFLSELQFLRDHDVVIVFPMVSVRSELERVLEPVLGCGFSVGITVETPAAALVSTDLLENVRFAEIGVNDLTQYTMAWDRDTANEDLLPSDKMSDAVLALAEMTFKAASATEVRCALGLDLKPSPTLAAQLHKVGALEVSCAARLVKWWKRAYGVE
jgi:phosphoenolpyruvate-protein phosphotransferase (PTS system enzyme I)